MHSAKELMQSQSSVNSAIFELRAHDLEKLFPFDFRATSLATFVPDGISALKNSR